MRRQSTKENRETDGSTIKYERANSEGYPRIVHYPSDGTYADRDVVSIHQLSAVAEYGIDAIAEADCIHHKDEAKINSGRDNLKPMDVEDHASHHTNKRNDVKDTSFHNKSTLIWLYVELGLTMAEIADKFDVTTSAICYWMDKHSVNEMERGPTTSSKQKPDHVDSDAVDRDPQHTLGDFGYSGVTAD